MHPTPSTHTLPEWPDWTRQIVTLSLIGEPAVETEGLVNGLFAVTPHHKGPAWCVTHVPTGRALAQHLVSADVAKQIIEIATALPFDWNKTDAELKACNELLTRSELFAPLRSAIASGWHR